MMIIILGMVGLGVEITFVLYKQRQMQSAADSAAFGGATALMRGYPADFRIESRAVAAAVGFVNGVDGVAVTVNRPPTLGPQAGNNDAVEVIVSQPQRLGLVSLFREGLFQVGARAVATLGGTGTSCILQSLPNWMTGISLSNGVRVELDECGMDANATGPSSLSVTGGARLTTQYVSVSGEVSAHNGARIDATDGIKTNQPGVADPYASVAQPSYSGCDHNKMTIGWSAHEQTIFPGVYCKGLAIGNSARVTMSPGVYIIDRGTFDIGGGTEVTGTGVTIFLTRSKGSDFAEAVIGNGARVELTAPTSGPTAGLVFFGDRNAPLSNTTEFGGGARAEITGAIYLPSQTVTFGNGFSNDSSCTQLIAGSIQFTGGVRFQNDCASTGVVGIGGSKVQLVE
ncbi:MAG: Tad domain-containing protein [Pseudolabrys sp.]